MKKWKGQVDYFEHTDQGKGRLLGQSQVIDFSTDSDDEARAVARCAAMFEIDGVHVTTRDGAPLPPDALDHVKVWPA